MTDMATVDGARAKVTTAAIEELRSRTRGVVLEPADQHEHDLRPVFNPMRPSSPAVTVPCLGTADVVAGPSGSWRRGASSRTPVSPA
jgi:hypothetical protein